MSDASDKLIRDHFEFQASGSEDIGSPFVAALCRLLAARLDDSHHLRPHHPRPGRPTPRTTRCPSASSAPSTPSSAPARSRPSPPPIHPPRSTPTPSGPRSPPPSPATTTALTAFLDSAPQTNEVARSGLILGGALHVAQHTKLPLEVFEIGSSAGLNLAFDEYRYDLGNGLTWGAPDAPVTIHCEWSGNLPPLDAPLSVVARAGLRPPAPRSRQPRRRRAADGLHLGRPAPPPRAHRRRPEARRREGPQGRRRRCRRMGRGRPRAAAQAPASAACSSTPSSGSTCPARPGIASTPRSPRPPPRRPRKPRSPISPSSPTTRTAIGPHDPHDLARRRARHPRPRPLPRPLAQWA